MRRMADLVVALDTPGVDAQHDLDTARVVRADVHDHVVLLRAQPSHDLVPPTRQQTELDATRGRIDQLPSASGALPPEQRLKICRSHPSTMP